MASHRHTTYKRYRKSKFKKQNWLVRKLSRIPHWVLWLLGVSIALVYVYAILVFVLHFSLPWKAQFGEVPEPNGYEVRGIDISHYQTDIRWDRLLEGELNEHPIRFVIMKATEGVNIFDPTFNENFHQAKANSFIRGAYHYFIPSASSSQQARYFLSQAHLEIGDLPPVLDVEESGNLTVAELQNKVRSWLRIVGEHYGTKPIIYTNYAFKMKYLYTQEFNEFPFWIAHYYKDKLDYKGPWVMWQYTDYGHIKGIKGNVDCNVFNGSIDDLRALCITEEQYPINIDK